MTKQDGAVPAPIVVKEVTVMTGNLITPMATVKAVINGKERIQAATGVGPVDAALNALRIILGDQEVKLYNFTAAGASGGSDTKAMVTIGVKNKECEEAVFARVENLDIVMASVNAFIDAANKLLLLSKK